jgi:hypothetical protein
MQFKSTCGSMGTPHELEKFELKMLPIGALFDSHLQNLLYVLHLYLFSYDAMCVGFRPTADCCLDYT